MAGRGKKRERLKTHRERSSEGDCSYNMAHASMHARMRAHTHTHTHTHYSPHLTNTSQVAGDILHSNGVFKPQSVALALHTSPVDEDAGICCETCTRPSALHQLTPHHTVHIVYACTHQHCHSMLQNL